MDPISNLSIIIPAYNEQKRITKTLAQLQEFAKKNIKNYEVLVIDDGSVDQTSDFVDRNIQGWFEARLIRFSKNHGKGWAIRKGVLEANKLNLCFMDADCSTDLQMLSRVYEKLSEQYPVVIGSRDLKEAEVLIHQFWLREYAAKLFNLWIQLWLLPGVWDTQCGFKFFRTEIARKLFAPLIEKRFGFDIEVLYRAKQMGLPIVEVPVRWSHVLDSRVNPMRDGLAMAWQVLRLKKNLGATAPKQWWA